MATTLTATIALERRYDEKCPSVHAFEKFEKCRPDGRWKPAGSAQGGREDPERRVQRDDREDDQDRVVENLLAPRNHVCPRSAMRVIANASTKITHASVKPTAAAEPICPSWNARS
jgi:hypothetical protein